MLPGSAARQIWSCALGSAVILVLAMPCRVTLIDSILATAVLLGLVLNALLGWWWADPAASQRSCRRMGQVAKVSRLTNC
jgi:hypothetical protein